MACITRDEAIALLQQLAARNGGWLSSGEYRRLSPPPAPFHPSIVNAIGVKTWRDACDVAGIFASQLDTFGDVLTPTQCLVVIEEMQRGGNPPSLEYRQQASAYCLQVAAEKLNKRTFTATEYATVTKGMRLLNARTIQAAFDRWNLALGAAGLEVKHTGGNRPQKGREERENQIMIDTYDGKYPADWRTHEWPLKTLEPVTEVTTVYRHATFAEYGLKYTETRMVLR